jgi:BirA family transcriptional regulator, biotin operon repressor / biotin---[acetyl-CoA-carboxylase] ligase
MNITVLTFDSIDSTNTEALKQARVGADEGLCIVARKQTAGRGRHGRTWVSDKNAGLYFSIVLRPKLDTRFLPLITLMTGVAVHDTLQEFGLRPDIKWVNDILVNEKKISGILAETTETSTGLAVIVGIGINIRSSNFPDEIADTATSTEAQSGQKPTADELANTLTRFFAYFYDILNCENGPKEILSEWRRRSTYFSGKSVRVILENEELVGTTDGLEENGALRVRKPDGSVTIIQAGDVELVRAAN